MERIRSFTKEVFAQGHRTILWQEKKRIILEVSHFQTVQELDFWGRAASSYVFFS